MLLLHVTNLFRAEIGKFDFFMRKKANLKQTGNFLQPFGNGRRVAKKPNFSPSPFLRTGFRLISMSKRIAKMNFATKKAYVAPFQSQVLNMSKQKEKDIT